MTIAARITAYLFLLVLGGISIVLSQASHGPAAALASPSQADLASGVMTPYCWVDVPPPNPGSGNASLRDVDAISATDIWAVGTFDGSPTGSIALHWNGSAWSIVDLPVLGHAYYLFKVVAFSPDNVWLVSWEATLLHWDGAQWNVERPVGAEMAVYGVAKQAPNTLWIATRTELCDKYCYGQIKYWNGSSWIATYGAPCFKGCLVHDLRALHVVESVDYTDVRAVGGWGQGLMYRWDGEDWIDISDNTVRAAGQITNITSTSNNDLWLVSATGLLHWNGISWATYSNLGVTNIYDIMALAPNDVWAVGYNGYLHWDGVAWERAGNPPFQTSVNAITAVNANELWAVGNSDHPDYHGMMISHYSPACVSTPGPTATATNTLIPTNTPTPTNTPEPPRCPSERFTDVCPTDYFYQHVLDLNDLNVVSGYNTAPPCDAADHIPCFKPYNLTTRGQVSKIISLAAGFNEPVSGQSFEDVPPGHTFYEVVGRMASRGIIVGYPCGGPGEPCGPENRPYFRVGATVNRAQLSKMAALTFGFEDPVSGQTFQDVIPGNHFYPFIENLAARQIINGYPCGGAGEPCVGPENRPYFRFGNAITRGQIAKIVNLARIEVEPSPTATSTATSTATPTYTPTVTSTPIATSTGTLTPTVGP